MGNDLYTVYCGSVPEARFIKELLENVGVEVYIRSKALEVKNLEFWDEAGFDPNIEVLVLAEMLETSVRLVETYLNQRSD